MGNDLQLDSSCLDNVTNGMRRHAALTICERIEDPAEAINALLMAGLVRSTSAGCVEDGSDAGVTWSRTDRAPLVPRVRPR